ncbi:hypothetical protein AMECASPLE_006984 [Ameca splendens]|uniref:Uncharacterized protein n=1 Tax=Ameca splendens TaxID=208324 RepID=A0ABV0YAP2_9TELE
MEEAGDSWQPPRLAQGGEGFFFPDPWIHYTIEAEQRRALGEIAASMRRPPAPSSARLSTDAGGSFPAHGLGPDQLLPLLPTPNPVPGPVPEGFMDEPPPHPDPVPSSGLVDGLPPLPAPVPGPVLEGSEDELPPSLFPVPEEFVEDLSPLPVTVPEGCEDAPSAPAVSRQHRRRSPQPRRGSQRSPHPTSVVHYGFSRSRRRLSDHQLLRRRPVDHWICRGRPPGQPPELPSIIKTHLT